MKYFLPFIAALFVCELQSSAGASSCPSYLGPNSRYVNIGGDSKYYVRVLTPPSRLPVVTVHERNGNQVYDDRSFEAFEASRPRGRYLTNIDIDLGGDLTLESVTHPMPDTTQFHLKRSFKVPADSSEVKIFYILTQSSVQIGSRSEIASVSYELATSMRQIPNGLIGRFANIATGTFVRGVFEKGRPYNFDISVVGSLLSHGSSETYVAEAVFNFGADGTLHVVNWLASGSKIEVSSDTACAPWKPCSDLLFRAVFGRELDSLMGLSPDLVREIALSAERREPLDIVKLLSFAPQRGRL